MSLSWTKTISADSPSTQGWTLQAIADALGASRQAVHQKYQRR